MIDARPDGSIIPTASHASAPRSGPTPRSVTSERDNVRATTTTVGGSAFNVPRAFMDIQIAWVWYSSSTIVNKTFITLCVLILQLVDAIPSAPRAFPAMTMANVTASPTLWA